MTLPAYAMNTASFPEMYERLLVGPLFRPWAEALLDIVGVSAGERVLDVACGTGIVARLAHERLAGSGRVVAVDLSPQMLAVAQQMEPGIDWREGDAAALPVGDDEPFDLVTCQQGLQFVQDRPAAAREMRRALAPGGRLAVATWRGLDEASFFRDLHAVAERHLGPFIDQRHSFGDGEALGRLLRDAGFHDVHVRTVSRRIAFADGSVIVRMNAMAVLGMSGVAAKLAADDRERLISEIVGDCAPVVLPYSEGPAVAFDLVSNVATARA